MTSNFGKPYARTWLPKMQGLIQGRRVFNLWLIFSRGLATKDIGLGDSPCSVTLWLPFRHGFSNRRCNIKTRKEGFQPSADRKLGVQQLKYGDLKRSCACQAFSRPLVVGLTTEEHEGALEMTWPKCQRTLTSIQSRVWQPKRVW